MKKLFVILILVALTVPAFAEKNHPQQHQSYEESYLKGELESLWDSSGDQSIGSIEFGELRGVLGELSVARQKDMYIKHSKHLSYMFPGLGQIKNDDKLSGALFMAADLALVAGSLVGAYFLLPADLQFAQLDYFNTPYSTVKERWESHTFVEMLPTMGVLAGGWLVQGVVRMWSAKHAEKLARMNVESGKVTFEPSLLLVPSGPGSMGFGMHMKY